MIPSNYKSIILTCAMLIFSQSSRAQNFWQQTNGPFGGQVQSIVLNPVTNTLYIGTYGSGVYYSVGNITIWGQTALNYSAVNCIALLNTSGGMVAGANGGVVYRTQNGGSSWDSAHVANSAIRAITINQTGYVFAGSEGDGVYRSTNQGMTWTQMISGLGNLSIEAFAVNGGGDVFAATSGGGIYRTTNNGTDWFSANVGLTNQSVHSIVLAPGGELYAGTRGDGVFKSPDNGITWTQTGLTNAYITALAVSTSGDIFAAKESGQLYRSFDGGLTWIQTGYKGLNILSLGFNTNNHLFVGTSGRGVFRTTDNGYTWTEVNNGLLNANIQALAVNQANGDVYAGSVDGGGVYRSFDHGNSWMQRINGLDNAFVYSLAVGSTGAIFCGTFNGVFVSTDSGMVWTPRGLSNYSIWSLAVNMTNGNIFAGTGDHGVYQSINNGMNWVLVSNGLPSSAITSLAIHQATGNIFAATMDSGIYFSSNNGANWISRNNGITNLNLNAVAINQLNGNIFVGTGGDGVFRSSDNGLTWTPVNYGITNTYILCLAIHPTSGYIFAGTYSGPFESMSNGNFWILQSSGMIANSTAALASDATGYIYAGTDGNSVYRSASPVPVELMSFSGEQISNDVLLRWITATETNNYGFEMERMAVGNRHLANSSWSNIGFLNGYGTSTSRHEYSFVDHNIEKGSTYQYRLKQIDVNGTYEYSQIVEIKTGDQKNNFRLEQNYPNPFKDHTTINLPLLLGEGRVEDSQRRGEVVFKIYDVFGREVLDLSNQIIKNSNLTIHNFQLPSNGIYFYKVTIDNQSQTKMMTLFR